MTVRALSSFFVVAAASLVLATTSDATTPGINGRIVFTRTDPTTHALDLFSANADGSDVLRLTWTGDAADAAVSPDGTLIAFMRGGGPNQAQRIWVMNADGSGQRQLTPDDSPVNAGDIFRPTWSPDGSRLAFTSLRPDRTGAHIWIINADGTNLHQLNDDPGVFPTWSPDGTRIAFQNGPLYVAGSDGSPATQITTPPSGWADTAPDWSPDGSSIVFARMNIVGSGVSNLFTIAADGTGLQPLMSISFLPAVFPSWSPDGTKVVFEEAGFPGTLWEINADGSGLTHLLGTGPGGFFGGLPGELPAWGTSTVRPRIDLTPPNIELRTPTEGAVYDMGGNSTVDYVCTDDLSGVASCEGTRPSGGSLDTGHAGAYSFQVTATDRAGNVSSKKVTYTVADRTPPTITITTPSAGGAYVLGATVSADYQCADEPGGSGMIACQATPIDTTSIGAKTFTVTASDNAGNTATASSSYAVIYAFAGFYSPTALYPAATSANAGQSVKLRFSLHGGQGLDVLAAGSPVWTPCSGGDTATATGTLSYQPTLDRYAYEVSTPKTWAGTCRDLVVTLRDSTVHKARFQFDK